MDNLLIGYIEDLKDYIITFNEALYVIDKDYEDKEVINTIFRVAHTIKGNSAAMQFMKIKQVMHTMEDILQEVREEKRAINEELLQILFSCHDFLEDCLSVISSDGNDYNINETVLLASLNRIKNSSEIHVKEDTPVVMTEDLAKGLFPYTLTEDSYELIMENLKRGMNLIQLEVKIREDTQMKTIRNVILFNTVEELGILLDSIPNKPDQEMMLDKSFVFDHMITRMLLITEMDLESVKKDLKKEPDVEDFKCNELTQNQIKEIFRIQNNSNPAAVQTGKSFLANKDDNSKTAEPNEFIRISAQKVDSIIEMLGELIIFNSQLEQYASIELNRTDQTRNIIPKMSKLIKSIQDLSMTFRMVPIKPILHKLTRIARDTSTELGKKVTVVLENENTEIDKSASEKLFDPLMHIIRNAVSHGIEMEEERLKRGKKAEGTIRINTYNKRSKVYIEVSDDGGGINPNLIYQKALEKNLIDDTKNYTEEEIIRLIFQPGFSTQGKIDGVSGRGVGMNVVESEIEKLRGKVEIRNEVGKGCTFVIKIPMNLAVLNGTIIELAGNRFIIPTLFIKQFLIIKPENWVIMQGIKKGIRERDSVIPIITADAILDMKTDQNLDLVKEMVILEMEQRFVAIPVDKILGRQEVVTKPLLEMFSRTEIFSGSSILGDGKVTMILDVEALFKLV